MPPNFSLQSVLDYRHNLVEAKEIELGQLYALQSEVEAQLEFVRKTEAQLLEAMNQILQGELDLVYYDQLRSQLTNLEKKKKEIQEKLEKIHRLVEEKRQELVEAKQDEEVLVILKDKEVKRFLQHQAHLELKVQDDIYISQAYQARNA